MSGPDETAAPFAFDGLDRVFHEKARLGIVSSLAGSAEGISFTELKKLCALTDGNLNRHLQVLDEAGFVVIEKSFNGRRPQTKCQLSELGRERFIAYLSVLEGVLNKATLAAAPEGRGAGSLSEQPS